MNETQSREAICRLGRSFFMRGLTVGATGNISVRLADGYLMTPTGVSLGELNEDRLARLADEGVDVLDVHVESTADSPNRLLIRVNYRIRETNAIGNIVYPFYITEGR